MDARSWKQLQIENERLRKQHAEQDKLIKKQQRTIEHLRQKLADLQKRLAESQRAAKRQAAPFSRGQPKQKPKKPGRKPGEKHGQHGHRPPPPPDQVDETHEAHLPDRCPACGGQIIEDRLDEQFQTEIPRRPLVRKFNIHCGHCQGCGKHFRGRHPLQTSDATGAAASQLGPDAQAAVVYLNKHAGMSHGKIADLFDKLFGIPLTRGASAQITLRGARRMWPAYKQIRGRIKTSRHVTPDETGWRVGGRLAWLHGWVGDDEAVCFVIDPRRGAEVLAEVIGFDWSNNMTHDGCSAYDRFRAATHQQCIDHPLRRARKLEEKQIGSAKRFPRQIIDLFERALRTRDQFLAGKIDQAARLRAHKKYVKQLDDLTARPRSNELNERFAQHLYNHGAQWFEFLKDPAIPATNHRAEQALRGPITNRKIWGGNRTPLGADAQQVESSVLATCRKKGIDPLAFISDAFRGHLRPLFPQPTRQSR
jgi:transposase